MTTDRLQDITEFKEIISGITNHKRQLIYGLSGGQKGFLLWNILKATNKNLLIITNGHNSAEKIGTELKTYMGEERVGVFPSNPLLPGEVDYKSKDIELQRIGTFNGIFQGNIKVLVTQVNSLLEIFPTKEILKTSDLTLKLQEEWEFDTLEKELVKLGYVRCDLVEKPGDFSIRGSILDVFPSISTRPVRIEFFGDHIESIRYFDTINQRSQEKIDDISIYTNTLNIVNPQQKETLLSHLNSHLRQSRDPKVQRKLKADIERIENNIASDILGQYNYQLYNGGNGLLEILDDYIIIFDETPFIKSDLDNWVKDYHERYKNLMEKGEVFGKIPLYYNHEEILKKINSKTVLHFCLLLRTLGPFHIDETVSLPLRQSPVFAGNLELFLEEIDKLTRDKYHVNIYYSKNDTKINLLNIFRDKEIPLLNSDGYGVSFHQGHLEEGFIFDKAKLAYFVETQIYKGVKGKKTKGLHQGVSITDISQLDIGDFVVHINHGIGIFKGINTLEVAGGKKDYIYVQYAGNDKLYIPTEQLNLLQKYVGGEGSDPKIYSLSGGEWAKTTKKARQSIREMAQSLVYLYAKRESTQGFKFSADTPWQNQFEDTFPYQETKDQLLAIKEAKEDMEKAKPMDRLLCGDVGYGKTEVAMRAAMKCVLDGKQVAVLVPTTILAQQHYKNFKERFSDFPVSIEVFSRFRTKKQIDEGLIKLTTGMIDIAIGTHKLLQKSVNFKDLGLIIVDEEQRFGVAHKERLKELKSNVDVLTMTATPIPRTLHMSMLGIRDLSVIETPPEDRFPVQTYVLEYNDEVITTAIKREVERGGQVYFVYNRVQSINSMAAKLQKMLPDCKIAVGHGQMSENALEKTMLDFMEGEYDILISTTIIETGLDIPNVNTLIIYDADKFGLSQLYQLRGRVGRSNRIAYCYLTYQKDKVLTEVAQKRLQSIKEFTDLGSGFKIALRDLEIRGAGNILGLEQHGFIASIGFDLYCQLLEEAIGELKGHKKEKPLLDINLELPIDGYIPDKLMNRTLKMSFYRRISISSNLDQIKELEEELYDRFGDLPEETTNLLDIARLKILGQNLAVRSITAKSEGYLQHNRAGKYSVELKFYSQSKIAGEDLLDIYSKNKNLEFSFKNNVLNIKIKKIDKNSILPETEKILHQLIAKDK